MDLVVDWVSWDRVLNETEQGNTVPHRAYSQM